MSERRTDEGRSADGRFPPGRRLGRRLFAWGAASGGAALVVLGAVLYANAGSEGGVSVIRASMWAFASGSALCVAGLYGRWTGPVAGESAGEAAPVASDDFLVPLLGALLVYRYRVLTEEQLQRALEQQRREGPNRRLLGEILLDMGLVTARQLETALAYQQEEARRKSAGRGGS